MTGLVWLGLGAAMLVVGAELFAENVVAAARRVGLTAVALGVLLAGAEPEEALTAGIASGRGHPALAVGDAIGANLVVLTVALGLAAVFTTLPVSRRVLQYAGVASLTGVVVLVLLLDGRVGRAEGTVLVLVYVAVVAWVWRRERRPPVFGEAAEASEEAMVGADRPRPPGTIHEDEADAGRAPAGFALLLALGGVLLMGGGGWLAVTGAERLVARVGLDDTGVGLTLLALATSVEMLALVASAARRGLAEVAVAGLVGAVAYNATVSVGVGALVAPLRGVADPRMLAVAGACVVLPASVALLARSRAWGRALGLLLVAGYLSGLPLLLT